MKTEDIYRFMQDASQLSETTLAEWKAIIEDFPWFQTARALYLKNLAMTEDIRFGRNCNGCRSTCRIEKNYSYI
ncbi:hypothetical protein LJC39_00995 [Parabacteroides sp. OttesenSCG-928-B22]|nr:hypothetical protein [Parabacteroides sp. OttesenSCG-928-B22]